MGNRRQQLVMCRGLFDDTIEIGLVDDEYLCHSARYLSNQIAPRFSSQSRTVSSQDYKIKIRAFGS